MLDGYLLATLLCETERCEVVLVSDVYVSTVWAKDLAIVNCQAQVLVGFLVALLLRQSESPKVIVLSNKLLVRCLDVSTGVRGCATISDMPICLTASCWPCFYARRNVAKWCLFQMYMC